MCSGAIVEQERFRFNGPNNAALISPATTKEQSIYFLKRTITLDRKQAIVKCIQLRNDFLYSLGNLFSDIFGHKKPFIITMIFMDNFRPT